MFEKIQNKLIPTNDIGAAIRRFPLSFACCILLYMQIVFFQNIKFGSLIGLALGPLAIGYFWFGVAALISESKSHSVLQQIRLAFGGFIPLVAILYLGWDRPLQNGLILLLSLLLALCFSPFINRKADDRDFWVFNRSLWFGVANALLMGGAVAVGLSAILGSLSVLFGMDLFKSFTYAYLFIALVYVPGLALVWVPKPNAEAEVHFGRECQVLVSWILMPFLMIYTVILYAYAIKIGFTMELPRGTVSGMVLGFSLVGLMTYMASWPLRVADRGRLQKVVGSFFSFLVVPLALMGLAIGVRIHEYGVTPDRYLLVMLFVSLTVIMLIYIRRNTLPMKYILMILAGGLFLSSFGPWSAAAVSNYDQATRLRTELTKANILVDGALTKVSKDDMSPDVQRKISGRVEYLLATRKLHRVHPDFKNFYSTKKKERDYNTAVSVMNSMGLDFVNKKGRVIAAAPEGVHFTLGDRVDVRDEIKSVSGYDIMTPAFFISPNQQQTWNKTYRAAVGSEYPAIALSYTPQGVLSVRLGEGADVEFDLLRYVGDVLKSGNRKDIPDLTKVTADGLGKITIQFTAISGVDGADTVILRSVRGVVLVGFAKP